MAMARPEQMKHIRRSRRITNAEAWGPSFAYDDYWASPSGQTHRLPDVA